MPIKKKARSIKPVKKTSTKKKPKASKSKQSASGFRGANKQLRKLRESGDL